MHCGYLTSKLKDLAWNIGGPKGQTILFVTQKSNNPRAFVGKR